jgi:putative DNA primase/helicase
LVSRQDLTAVSEEQIRLFLVDAAVVIGAKPPHPPGGGRRIQQAADLGALVAVDPDALAAIVEKIPNGPAFDDRSRFVAMAHAVAAAFAPDIERGRCLFFDWCDRWHRGAQGEGEVEGVWDSIQDSEHQAGAGWILRQAADAGIDTRPYQLAWAQSEFEATADPPGDAPVQAGEDAAEIGDEAPPVLSPAAPLDSAREMVRRMFMQQQYRTLHHQQDTFYRWRGTHYAEAAREEVRATVYDFLDGVKQMNDNGKLVSFNPNKAKVANVLEALAASAQLDGSIRAPAWLDDKRHPPARDILACANGLLHLPTRVLLPLSPTFFGLNAVDYAYDATAENPAAWLEFLASIWSGDQKSVDTLQELFGLLLTADTSHQKAFLIVGPKRSGKGTIARVLTALLGKENVAGPTLGGLSQNFGLAPLIGKPLAIISDARLGGRADAQTIAERILAITGEDSLSIDRKFRDAWTGRLPTRFLILTNELPKLQDASGALASRFIVLRLTRSFFGKENHALTQRLVTELPAILQWAMAGRDRLAERRYFVQPESARQAVMELEDLASPIGAFLRDRCVVGSAHCVECEMLYAAWSTWCTGQHRDHPGTVQTFGRDLRAAVPDLATAQPRDRKTGGRLRYYQGVGLVP